MISNKNLPKLDNTYFFNEITPTSNFNISNQIIPSISNEIVPSISNEIVPSSNYDISTMSLYKSNFINSQYILPITSNPLYSNTFTSPDYQTNQSSSSSSIIPSIPGYKFQQSSSSSSSSIPTIPV